MDVLCSDKTGTLTKGEMEVEGHRPALATVEQPFLLAFLNSNFETGIKSPSMRRFCGTGNLTSRCIPQGGRNSVRLERRLLSVAVDGPNGRQLITKGLHPESVLRRRVQYQANGTVSQPDIAAREEVKATCAALSTEGFRLLAVAVKSAPGQDTFRVADEAGLTLVGLLAFLDPPRDDTTDVVRSLREDGVGVKVLTGDNELVTRHVCMQVGLDVDRVVLGNELDDMTDSALGHVAEEVSVFARLSPGQKNRVLRALQSRGHVVGFLGDGVNDSPSLRAADVGITVSSAVDVAKEAAEVILMEPGLNVLHSGILEGRRAFGNVMKYLLMGTSSNFGNMLSMAVAVAFLPFLPMLPMQILLNSLMYDVAQLTIPTDRVDASYLHKPRRWDVGLIRRFMLVIGPVSSLFDFVTFFVLLHLFHQGPELFHTGWFVESLATQTLVLFVIRTGGSPFRSRPSRPLTVTILAVVFAGLLLPYSPLAVPLGFVALPVGYLVFVVLAVVVYLALVEAVKRRLLGTEPS
ncbi:MAG: HAD-IC family P-type ATPase [Gemmataceae bacterium]